MAFKVQVGPAQVAIHGGRTVLVCNPDGTVPHPGDAGAVVAADKAGALAA